jgi:hypothetical protein
VRNARSVAVDGRIGAHDPPRFAGGLPSRYAHRLLPVCCRRRQGSHSRDRHVAGWIGTWYRPRWPASMVPAHHPGHDGSLALLAATRARLPDADGLGAVAVVVTALGVPVALMSLSCVGCWPA